MLAYLFGGEATLRAMLAILLVFVSPQSIICSKKKGLCIHCCKNRGPVISIWTHLTILAVFSIVLAKIRVWLNSPSVDPALMDRCVVQSVDCVEMTHLSAWLIARRLTRPSGSMSASLRLCDRRNTEGCSKKLLRPADLCGAASRLARYARTFNANR